MPAINVTARTGRSHPFRISTIDLSDGGRIGLAFCPGKKDPHAMTGTWSRGLVADIDAIRKWGASTLVTLMESHELEALHVPTLGGCGGDDGVGLTPFADTRCLHPG